MNIIYNGLDITIATPIILALIALVKWIIDRHDKKKNVPKTPGNKA